MSAVTIMLLFGFVVAGLEAANLEVVGASTSTEFGNTTVNVNLRRWNNLKTEVYIWSGAIVAIAAIMIFIFI